MGRAAFLAVATAAVLSVQQPSATSAAEPLWRQLMPRKKVDADPQGDYTLTENHGPWLIMAASFSGERAEDDARKLVVELRQRFNMPAFYYAMTFTMDGGRVGTGIDDYGAPVKRRYARGRQVLEHAVLVGEYPAIDDTEAQAALDRIKTIEPETLKTEGAESSSQSLATVRQFHRYVKRQLGRPESDGPMGHAFLTRNPLLPREFFTPGIDPEVVRWNEGLEFSALRCPKKYTIRVATFRGRSTLQGTNDLPEKKPRRLWQAADEPLVVAGENAHKLTVALRSLGWEAYEFHDRHESYVTIGAFDEVQETPDGRLAPATREAQTIAQVFSAATPYNQYTQGGEMSTQQHRAAVIEEFNRRFSAGLGEVSEGFYPKQLVGLPFDIEPVPIAAPKQSIGAAYARR